MICLKTQNLIKSTFTLFSLLGTKQTREALLKAYAGGGNQEALLGLYKHECLDSEGILSYFLAHMRYRVIPNSADRKSSTVLGGLTDAVCLMYAMDDEEVSRASLALYALNNRNNSGEVILGKEEATGVRRDIIDQVLDHRGSGQLDFGSFPAETAAPKFKLADFISKPTYKDVVLKIVDLSEGFEMRRTGNESMPSCGLDA
mmetsp:Transcript_31977/g.48947  ORF Transcript_31977/g.48947 Transcript_31977/m.48947 type:complete len:202 (+) Transcript_31977:947-1552(+)